jgi:polyisoprenoid-binding protein YceI
MNRTTSWRVCLVFACGSLATSVAAEPVTYEIDPSHTFPSFEADHWAGLSVWRGKVNSTSGTIVLDKDAETGSMQVTMDMATIDFGHEGMNNRALEDILHVEQFPTATYVGEITHFDQGVPVTVEGELTMHGITRPVNLTVNRFRCQRHFRLPVEVCGADASTTIYRDEFGMDYDKENGFFMAVDLQITVEAHSPREE